MTDAAPVELAREATELLKDIRDNAKSTVGITDIGDLTKHMNDTLWPTLEAIGEIFQKAATLSDEHDAVLDEIIENAADKLSEETAGLFANAFLMAKELVAELEKRLSSSGDADLKAKIKAFGVLLEECEEELEEVTVEDPDDEEAE